MQEKAYYWHSDAILSHALNMPVPDYPATDDEGDYEVEAGAQGDMEDDIYNDVAPINSNKRSRAIDDTADYEDDLQSRTKKRQKTASAPIAPHKTHGGKTVATISTAKLAKSRKGADHPDFGFHRHRLTKT